MAWVILKSRQLRRGDLRKEDMKIGEALTLELALDPSQFCLLVRLARLASGSQNY
jgi:hypothetical protein